MRPAGSILYTVRKRSMSPGKLRISGPGGTYRPGDPILIHDGALFLGTIEPPAVSRDGANVHFGRFSPAPLASDGQRQFAPLMLVEVMTLITEHFENVEAIRFTLTRQVEMHGDGPKVALARLALLERIGAANLQMTPRPDSAVPGNFVVQGVWEYNSPNLAALATELLEQRSIYFQVQNFPEAGRESLAGRWMGRLLRRPKP